MTCAKKRIYCALITTSGDIFTAENLCDTPQPVCPRDNNEGYEKCVSVCHQPDHAETAALKKARDAGVSVIGAAAIIQGTYNVCKACARALYEAGVETIIIKPCCASVSALNSAS